MKTSDARVVNVNAYLKPLDLRRMLVAASVLENNKFFKEAHEITLTASENFPDSFEAWSFLLSLTNSTEVRNLHKSEWMPFTTQLVHRRLQSTSAMTQATRIYQRSGAGTD
jgi:hypothetical protein